MSVLGCYKLTIDDANNAIILSGKETDPRSGEFRPNRPPGRPQAGDLEGGLSNTLQEEACEIASLQYFESRYGNISLRSRLSSSYLLDSRRSRPTPYGRLEFSEVP